MKGYIFDIKKFAVHDGPGIRTTLFLKGCPLRCVWCHNPEGLNKEPQLWYFPNKCIHCGLCIQSCPEQALSKENNNENFSIKINHDLCTSCAACVAICPTEALQFDGRVIDHEEAVNLLLEDRSFYEESGGGITLSGGDPVFQSQFSKKILESCKTQGIHTAIESALYCSTSVLEELIPFTDLFICDLKLFDDELHREYTGISNSKIKENLEFLATQGKQLLIRTPLIPEITAVDDNLRAIGAFLLSLGGDIQYELLNYNQLAMNKYNLRNEENIYIHNAKPFTDAQLRTWVSMMEGLGLNMVVE